jgi:hypothetical protein
MGYQKSEKLTNLIKDKSVVLVGPSNYLVGRKLGTVINNYDTVCRVNYMAPSTFTEDYGNRTDIMFYNCSTASIHQMKQHFIDEKEFAKNIKLVVCPVVKALGPEKWTKWNDDYVSEVVSNFDSMNMYNNDFYWIGISNYKYFFNLMNCTEPNSGILSMYMILEHEPKELFITGCTFYLDKGKYFPNYATPAPGWKGRPGHPQGDQIVFFKKHILSKVKIDSYLNNLLKLKHNKIQTV